MSNPLYYVFPDEYAETVEFQNLTGLAESLNLINSRDSVIPRGGDGFSPGLTLAIAFIGTAYASGLIGAIASEHYSKAKRLIKRGVSTVPPRGSDWPSQLKTPSHCTVTLTIKTEKHVFLITIPSSIASSTSIDAHLEMLPNLIDFLNSNPRLSNHLISLDVDGWKIGLIQEFDYRRG